jgi:hypothetical protein
MGKIDGIEVFNSDKDWRERGFHLRTAPVIIVSYDPAGDGDDRDAIIVTSREEHQRGEPHDPDFAVEMKFRVLMGQRIPVDFEFPDKVAKLLAIHRQLTQWQAGGRIHTHAFAVESNGVGWGLASDLRSKIGESVLPYTTIGSAMDKPYGGGKINMPRLAALDHLRIMMETHHLKLIPGAPGSKEIISELNSFVWRRPGRPEAMDGQKDDLVMALCGGVWVGSKIIGPTLKGAPTILRPGRAN